MKAFDAVVGTIVVVGLVGLVVSQSKQVKTLLTQTFAGAGYLTQVAQMRPASNAITSTKAGL